jgi:uncharacterized protein
MYKFNLIDKLSVILVLIGALNWGLIGLFDLNIVEIILKLIPLSDLSQALQRIVYILVGAAGINIMFLIYKTKYANSK